MSKALDKAVSAADDGTYGFTCPVTDGSCGADGVPFTSTEWPTKKAAAARLQQHIDDHRGTAPMQTLEDFREAQGLVENNGVVTVKDL